LSFLFGFLFTDSNLGLFLYDPRSLWGCKGSENQEGSRVVWGKRKIEMGYFGFTIPDKACVQDTCAHGITQQGDDPGVFDQSCHQASLVAQLVKNLSAMQETWVLSLGWEDPLQKGMATHSSSLAGRIPWGHKESDTTERLSHHCNNN